MPEPSAPDEGETEHLAEIPPRETEPPAASERESEPLPQAIAAPPLDLLPAAEEDLVILEEGESFLTFEEVEQAPAEISSTDTPVEAASPHPTEGARTRLQPRLAEVFPDLPEAQSRRLQTLLGRQARLPLDVEPSPPPPRRGQAEPAESREELIERLLDPILSINEAATLCGVCPASIRRYTNRGALRCFRTPGNQRRFRLSDVLDFMERQQQEILD